MVKKKLVSVLVIACMVTAMFSACGKKATNSGQNNSPTGQGNTSESNTGTTEGKEPSGQIIIGSTTELGGDWVPYFQNGAADYDVYQMIEGYGTVDLTSGGEYVIDNTVVKDYTTTINDDGSKTYTYTINEGLVWNDGTEIKAIDYVTSVMLWSSKVIADMGGDNTTGKYFKGWREFANGESKVFTGVRLLGDYSFSVTIDAQYLPYYYELAMVGVGPVKLSFWTDENVTIKDDGEGCYFSDNFTKENYEEKINNARRAIPRVTAGPYNLKSFDEASKTGVLEANPLYKGNWEGQKAQIKTIIYKKVTSETMLDELKTGSVDLLNGITDGSEITEGLDMVDAGGFNYTAYDRAGYGKLMMICDFGPTQFVEVRQAIAYLLDRNDFAKAFTGGYGSVVNGPYGVAMWMYKESKDELDEKLNQYAYSLEMAKKVLEEGGWIYDKDGNPYKEGIRYKKLDDGTLMPLILEWAASEQNSVSELLVVKLQQNPDVAAAGMQINQTVMTFTEMLNYIYRDDTQGAKYGEPTYHLYNLATNFTPRYDLSDTYTIDPDLYAQGLNTNFIQDEELSKLAEDMVLTDPTDREGYRQKFVKFVERWNYLLPDLPLYSNIYHDFYNEKLKNYNVNALFDMSYALLYAYVEE